jgi:hypothetical protein
LTISPSHPVTPTLLATVSGGREVRAAVFGVSAANPDGQPYFKALGDGKIGMTANIAGDSATFSDLLIHFDARSLS